MTLPTADTITQLRTKNVKSIKIYNIENNHESSRYHVLYVEAQAWFPMYLRNLYPNGPFGVYVADIHIPLDKIASPDFKPV